MTLTPEQEQLRLALAELGRSTTLTKFLAALPKHAGDFMAGYIDGLLSQGRLPEDDWLFGLSLITDTGEALRGMVSGLDDNARMSESGQLLIKTGKELTSAFLALSSLPGVLHLSRQGYVWSSPKLVLPTDTVTVLPAGTQLTSFDTLLEQEFADKIRAANASGGFITLELDDFLNLFSADTKLFLVETFDRLASAGRLEHGDLVIPLMSSYTLLCEAKVALQKAPGPVFSEIGMALRVFERDFVLPPRLFLAD